MAKLTKSDLVEKIAKSCNCSKRTATQCLDSFVETITKSLKKGVDVGLTGFGTFTTSRRKARKGRNPQTGEEIKIPAKRVPRFKPGKALKDALS